jgi:hypothetical protein
MYSLSCLTVEYRSVLNFCTTPAGPTQPVLLSNRFDIYRIYPAIITEESDCSNKQTTKVKPRKDTSSCIHCYRPASLRFAWVLFLRPLALKASTTAAASRTLWHQLRPTFID